MSRRFKIGILTKKKYDKIKNLSFQELKEKYGNEEGIEVSRLSKEVFCIGKSFDDSSLKKHTVPAFSEEVHKLVNKEDAFYLIDQEGFKCLIDLFRMEIAANFKELLGNLHQKNQEIDDARFAYIYFRLQEWNNDLGIKNYNLEDEKITRSDTPEYAIWELIRIYKSINWETQLVTISAW